jgi:WD40 repeat protein
MRLRLFVFAPVLGIATALLMGCGKKPPVQDPVSKAPSTPQTPEAVAKNTDVGSPLYPGIAAPVFPTAGNRNEPIVISNALVQFEERHIVSAEVDGTLELFAAPILPGEKVERDRIVYHPRDTEKKVPLKRLSEGDDVTDGMVIAFIDERQVEARIKGQVEVKQAAEVARAFAKEGADRSLDRVKLVEESFVKGGASKSELIDAQLNLARFRENESNALQTIAKTSAELAEATVMLDRHRVRSRVNGIIRSIEKRPGSYAKAGEKIMELEATDRVRIEGQLDVQYAPFVRRDMPGVTVEPAVPSAPTAYHTGHRAQVSGIAVTSHPEGPLVVSVGADGGALVWDPNLGKKPNRPNVAHNLPHPVGVRSVAATPATAKGTFVITGADDGKIRIWDVANRDRLPTAPKSEPEDAHTSAVLAIAVSPEGQYFASAAGRDVFIWDIASGKRKYVLPQEHRDNVTAVSFTPQGTLVTASKDGTLKVWKLGTEKAAVIRTFDHRAGAVEVLGVSRDGARVLFDQDKGRIDLVDLSTGQTVGQMQNVSSNGTFSTLALFGQQDVPAGAKEDPIPPYGVLTVGGDGDLRGTVQYWHAPRTGGRATEVGRLITPGRVPVTAAAFSAVRSEPFLVVGTSTGGVYLWKPPSEARQTHAGRIALIDDTDTRYVTVRVEMDNKQLKLRDKSAATIIIPLPNP